MNGKRPHGIVGGVLVGDLPNNAAWGYPCAVGYAWVDDFISSDVNSVVGEKRWEVHNGSGTFTAQHDQPVTDAEAGVCEGITGASSGDWGGIIVEADSASKTPWTNPPPVGVVWTAKIRLRSSSDTTAWAGFIDDGIPGVPEGATNCDFIGIRAQHSVDSNWFGVVRIGTSENTVDLGVTANTSYAVFGFERVADGFQFFRLDCSRRGRLEREDIGDPLSLPAGSTDDMGLMVGARADAASTKGWYLDWVTVGGRVART